MTRFETPTETTERVNNQSAVRLAKFCKSRPAENKICPLNPKSGCACQYVAYHRAPWWRKLFMKTSICPSQQACDNAVLAIALRRAIIKFRNQASEKNNNQTSS
jgi:hypothetical protein